MSNKEEDFMKLNIKKLIKGLYMSLKRFPLAILFSTATTVIAVILVNNHFFYSTNTIDVLQRIAMSLALGFPLFISLKLLFERIDNYKEITKYGIQLLGGVLLLLYYFFLLKELNMVPVIRFIALNLALYLTVLMVHYFYRRNNFELYNVQIFKRIFITAIYSAVLYSGLAAIIFTLNKLLGLPVSSELYITILLIVAGIFAPIFLLAGVPLYHQKFSLDDYPGFLKILLLYIVIPIISVYTAILYLYFIKILVTWQWPQGLVAHLVLWYSVVSLIVIFFISPLTKKNNWLNYFVFWFPKAILPLLLMMFLAIGIRINAYGVTENRYFVFLLGLWVFGVMIYYNLAKQKRNIVLPLSLAVIAVLSVFGPWSSFAVSINSQNNRLEEILNRNNMIKEERIIKKEGPIAKEDQKQIIAIITYFKNNHSLDDVKYLPADFNTKNMEQIFGFQYKPARHFYRNFHRNNVPVKISGYDYFMEIPGKYIPNYEQSEEQEELKYDSNLRVRYSEKDHILEIIYKDNKLYSKSLREDMVKIYRKIENKQNNEISPEDYTIIDENNNIKIKILIKDISARLDEAVNDIVFSRINFYIFVDIKD